MASRSPRMIHLGYGKWARADRVFAVVPLEGSDRGDGRRTYVHVEGLSEPVVASRSERAILSDVEDALQRGGGGGGARPGRRGAGGGGGGGSSCAGAAPPPPKFFLLAALVGGRTFAL